MRVQVTIPPLRDAYVAAGLDPHVSVRVRQAADYYVRQGRDADALAAELATPELRRRYVATFYGSRSGPPPAPSLRADVDFMTEPFADAERLRAGFGNYESALGTRPLSEPPRFLETNPVPTLVLYGPDDHVIYPDFCRRAEVVFSERVGAVHGRGRRPLPAVGAAGRPQPSVALLPPLVPDRRTAISGPTLATATVGKCARRRGRPRVLRSRSAAIGASRTTAAHGSNRRVAAAHGTH